MRRAALVLLLLLGAVPAPAQPSDEALEAALVHWRAASWYVRLGNDDVAALEADAFRDKWRALGPSAPAGVTALADTAALALETNDTVTAGRTLGAIGDRLAEARRAAGPPGFPEAMRVYRDTVERLAGLMVMSDHRGTSDTFDPALKAEVRGATVAAAEAASRLLPQAPARWANQPTFRTLLQQNIDGLAAVIAAYNLLFLSYGY
jgi:hypothetical protein